MKGRILASRSVEDFFEAEESLLSSIDWANRQSATLFELRAATDPAELLLKQDRVPEADQHLRAALDRMPAGIVSPDRKRALQILNQLQSGIEAIAVKPSTAVRCLRNRVQVLAFRYKPGPVVGCMLWRERSLQGLNAMGKLAADSIETLRNVASSIVTVSWVSWRSEWRSIRPAPSCMAGQAMSGKW
jgi:hypothetical protein